MPVERSVSAPAVRLVRVRWFAVLPLLLVLGLAGMAHAAGSIERHTLASALLGRDYAFTVYLPQGYAPDAGPYPVIYLLHGANGDEHDWPVKGNVGPTLDRLIDAGTLPPVIAVMPGHKQMWWVDGNAEPAESVLFDELMPAIEARFPVLRSREGRAIAGLSAGGHAVVRQILKRPEMFAAAAALSPAIYRPVPPDTSSAMKDPPFRKNDGFDRTTWEALNWPPLWEGYVAQPLRVPLYMNTGDHDRFEIAWHAAGFHLEMQRLQPKAIEFRIYDGGHEWPLWERTIGEALEFIAPHLAGKRAPGP